MLGGSWVVISRVRSRVTIVITYIIRRLITPLMTTQQTHGWTLQVPSKRVFWSPKFRGILRSNRG